MEATDDNQPGPSDPFPFPIEKDHPVFRAVQKNWIKKNRTRIVSVNHALFLPVNQDKGQTSLGPGINGDSVLRPISSPLTTSTEESTSSSAETTAPASPLSSESTGLSSSQSIDWFWQNLEQYHTKGQPNPKALSVSLTTGDLLPCLMDRPQHAYLDWTKQFPGLASPPPEAKKYGYDPITEEIAVLQIAINLSKRIQAHFPLQNPAPTFVKA